MIKKFALLCFLLLISCTNEKKMESQNQAVNNEPKLINVIQKEEEKVIEEKENEKEEVKIDEEVSNSHNDYGLEEIEVDGEIKYFSNKLNKIIESKDIFRKNIMKNLKYKYNINIDGLNIEKFKINGNEIFLGDNFEVKLNIEENKNLFAFGTELPSIYEGDKLIPKKREIDPNKKHIAFTFDDGPGNQNHEKIRELFNKYDETATFFFVGFNVKKNKDMVLKTYLDGHEIENHTYNHPNLRKLDYVRIWSEISKTDDEIYRIIGIDTTYLRPPYGAFNDATINLIGGKKNMALWNVDSEDWKSRNVEKIIERVLDKVKDGDIVLFHDLYQESYEAVEIMVPILKDRGFQFVSYNDILKLRKNKGV